jgi:two-component system, NarL family, response regulator LiaR
MLTERDGSSAQRRRPITIVLLDEEALTRSVLSQALARAGIDVVGEAASEEEGLTLVVDLRPDVVVIDLRLPGISGINAIEQLSLLAPASRILVRTARAENRVVEAIVAGATGYILTSAAPEAVVDAVRVTASGGCVLSPDIAAKLLERIRERDMPVTASSKTAAIGIRAALTERELEIFARLASGASNQDIALELSLSPNTISNHVASILAKLHVDNRIQAAVQAVRSGIS